MKPPSAPRGLILGELTVGENKVMNLKIYVIVYTWQTVLCFYHFGRHKDIPIAIDQHRSPRIPC